MAWEHAPPEITLSDQLTAKHGVTCPDCGLQFDPFEARDSDGVPDHECLLPVDEP